MIFEPLDFIACLTALVPKPRVNLTGFHGMFAPNSKPRSAVIEKILPHLQAKLAPAPTDLRPASRAPPADLFG